MIDQLWILNIYQDLIAYFICDPEAINNFYIMMKKSQDPTYVEDIDLEVPTSLHATASEEHAVMRKLDYRLLPLLFVLYSLSVLDRSNLGNARLAGLAEDIDLGDWRYNWLGTCFYIACKVSSWCVH